MELVLLCLVLYGIYYNKCCSNPMPLIHMVFPAPEILFLLFVFAVQNFLINN